MKKLYRSRTNSVLFGICGGIAEYFNIDATVVRVATVVLGVLSGGTIVLAYILCLFIMPKAQ
ncbi:MAG TPA: PspC domain-containing protein [Candidatus Saccharibacteria bacterium]|nr:PspC domain-containing protein [Candidatus Saccharibacteria bacterium]MCB9817185.1 PspC domain-containing protein [Candidatus Nomurabacteria bacterium]HPD98977.1 PspC domain-containing protein [Candidatus Saccharibacteria bacterium]HPR10405.1 PspC domain-containing protein [Candidatus Saccharibacteria bacterium]